MESDYTVKISLTEHRHDNFQKPYYWSLLKYDNVWQQIAFGWEGTPQDCLTAALDQYNDIVG